MTDYDRKTLVDKWTRIYSATPPKGLSRTTLELAISYNEQAKYEDLPKKPNIRSVTPEALRA